MFDGTLGTWKTDPVDLEFKRSEGKTLSCQVLPGAIFAREKTQGRDKKIMLIRCIKKDSQLMFTIAKPDGSLRSLADLREVNKVIKRKTTHFQRFPTCNRN